MSDPVLQRAAKAKCDPKAGRCIPVIDPNRCEGKGDCVDVCPYDVFQLGILAPERRKALSLKGKIKGVVHRWKQGLVINPDACRACGLCVVACPENAILLTVLVPH